MKRCPFRFLIFPALAALSLIACPDKTEELPNGLLIPRAEADELSRNSKATLVTELNFDEDEHELSDEQREKLRRFVENAKRIGHLSSLSVISWAQLGNVEEPLDAAVEKERADARNRAIAQFLEEHFGDLEIHRARFAERSREADEDSRLSAILVVLQQP